MSLKLEEFQQEAFIDLKYLEGIFTDEILDQYFGEWYQNKIRQYKNCKFDRIIYVVNKKVFYADQPLNEDDSMCCW